MKYSEVFHSIQGEGKLVGVPSVFFRTSYCNLRCVWCDTPYTSWQPENRDISVDEAFERIRAFGCRHVVVTGGEPLIQSKEIIALCDRLATAGHHITIETNATVFVPVRADLISMSPKLANSNPPKSDSRFASHEAQRVAYDVIRAFLDEYECQAKFVVDAPDDMDEIDDLIEAAKIPADVVMLMPQARTAAESRAKLEWLADICKARGFRLSPRLHLDIWGARRGV